MNPIDFPEANLTLTRPADMTDEECASLRVLRDAEGFTSCWMPSGEERAAIAAGAPVVLKVIGRGHPPVLIAVRAEGRPVSVPPSADVRTCDTCGNRAACQPEASDALLANGATGRCSYWAPVALRSPIAARVLDVGSFEGEASPLAVLELGGHAVRIPVTPEEARALGARLHQTIRLRLAVEE